MADYISKNQQRLLSIQIVLAGHEFNGLAPSEIANSVRTSASNVTHDLANLQEAGLAERVPALENRWRLGPKAIQMFRAHSLGMERIRAQVVEFQQRYSREHR